MHFYFSKTLCRHQRAVWASRGYPGPPWASLVHPGLVWASLRFSITFAFVVCVRVTWRWCPEPSSTTASLLFRTLGTCANIIRMLIYDSPQKCTHSRNIQTFIQVFFFFLFTGVIKLRAHSRRPLFGIQQSFVVRYMPAAAVLQSLAMAFIRHAVLFFL